jgi:hypothetical protein
LWTDYAVTNNHSGKTYRVALRGWERGNSYCSCPDFRKNTLGTCKHILFVVEGVKKKFSPKVRNTPYLPDKLAVHVLYGEEMELRLLVPPNLDPRILKVLRPFLGRPITDLRELLGGIKEVERLGREVMVYPDAEEFIRRNLAVQNLFHFAHHHPELRN